MCYNFAVATGALAGRLGFREATALLDAQHPGVRRGGLPMSCCRTLVFVCGGDTAVEEVPFLTRFAARVVFVHCSAGLHASWIMRERAQAHL